eukprot:Lankesteria_metandrocarpae@DN2338_c0_g1_i1.p1
MMKMHFSLRSLLQGVFFVLLCSVAVASAEEQQDSEVSPSKTTTAAVVTKTTTAVPSWITIPFNGPILNVDAYAGEVYAKSEVGLLHLEDGQLKSDEFLGHLPIGRIWIQPPAQRYGDNSGASVFVVSTEGKLYRKFLSEGSKPEWRDCLEGTTLEGRKVLDIHGKAEFLVFIVERERTDNKSKTVRGDLYLSPRPTSKDFLVGEQIGSFPATFVTVSQNKGTIVTYGDYFGPYGASVGVSTDFGQNWRHNIPQAAGKDGRVYGDEDRIVVTSAIGNVMVSYDKGRTYKALTPTRGKLPLDHYTDVAAVDDVIFVATKRSGLFVSTDDGESFEKRATAGYNNFPVNALNAVAVDIPDHKVYVAFSNGISIRDISHGSGKNEPMVREHLSLWKSFTQEAKGIF